MDSRTHPLSALQALDPDCSREEWATTVMAAEATGVPFDEFRGWRQVGVDYAGDSECHSMGKSVSDQDKEKQSEAIACDINREGGALPAQQPSRGDSNEYMSDFGAAASDKLQAPSYRPTMRFKVLSGADLGDAPPIAWLLRGVLPASGLAGLYGPSGSGKSFLVLDLAAAIASGSDRWFGQRIVQAPVTYVALEGESGMGKRVKAWSLFHGQAIPAGLRFITQPVDLRNGGDVNDLAAAICGEGGAGGLVIIDTLNRAAPGADENASTDMGRIIASAKQLQLLTGGLVLLIHHSGKDTARGMRGHSSLYAALDGAIEVSRAEDRREWRVAKSKDDEDGQAFPFKLEVQATGIDEEGEEITSCVVMPEEAAGKAGNNKQMKRSFGPNEKIAMDALEEALKRSRDIGKEGAPAGHPCLRLDDAIDLVAERLTSDKKHRRERARQTLDRLLGKGIFGLKNDWLWRI